MRNEWGPGRNYSYAASQNNPRRTYNNPQQYSASRNDRNSGTERDSERDNLKIHEEFDIDDANKKFDKTEFLKELRTHSADDTSNETHDIRELSEVEDGEVPEESTDATKFYDKSKSFFDSISCESLEKKMGRLTLAEEKKLNAQTFGVPSAFRNQRQYNGYNGARGGGYYNQQRRGGNYYGGYGQQTGGNYNNYRRPGSNNYYSGGSGANNYYTNNYNSQSRRGGAAHSAGGDRRQQAQNPSVSAAA
jgi:protein LSM14